MKVQVPQRSDSAVVTLEFTAPDFFKVLEVSNEISEIKRDWDVDERLLRITAQPRNNSREPIGVEIVLKEAEVVEPEVPEQEPEQGEEPSEGIAEGIDDLWHDDEREEEATNEVEEVDEVEPPWRRQR